MLSEEESIVVLLSEIIEELDRRIFKNPAEVVVLQEKPKDEGERFGFYHKPLPPFIMDKEFYLVFKGKIKEWLRGETQKGLFLFSEEALFNTPESYSGEMVLIGIAGHELRHRFQYHNSKEIFLGKNINKLNDFTVRRLFRYCSLVCRKVYGDSLSEGAYSQELDAMIIEHLVLKDVTDNGFDYNRIAQIIMTKRKVFLGEN